jgi:uncharacterized protein (UPF0264 family)
MTYKDAMKNLNDAIYTAIKAGNAERQNVTELREMAADIDHIIDHGCTREDRRNRKIAEGAVRQAGWTA